MRPQQKPVPPPRPSPQPNPDPTYQPMIGGYAAKYPYRKAPHDSPHLRVLQDPPSDRHELYVLGPDDESVWTPPQRDTPASPPCGQPIPFKAYGAGDVT